MIGTRSNVEWKLCHMLHEINLMRMKRNRAKCEVRVKCRLEVDLFKERRNGTGKNGAV